MPRFASLRACGAQLRGDLIQQEGAPKYNFLQRFNFFSTRNILLIAAGLSLVLIPAESNLQLPTIKKLNLVQKETLSHSSAAISFPAQQNSCMSVLKRFQPLLATCISSNLGHQGALLELAVNVATRWHYLHWL